MPLPAAARAAGRAGQRDRQARALRLLFGAIVNRSPLVNRHLDDGAAPVLRNRRSAPSSSPDPARLARWADAARRWRAGGSIVRTVVCRPAQVLAAVHPLSP